MSSPARKRGSDSEETVRVLGRGLRAQRGVRLTLRALREAAGLTQMELAERTEINQADISRLESREDLSDCQVSTLQRYLAALGCGLDLVATSGDKKFTIVGPASASTPKRTANKPLQRADRKTARR
jgi:transcriptional regulator with XRE-family HTH domain